MASRLALASTLAGLMLASCGGPGAGPSASTTPPTAAVAVQGTVLAGPVCPVVREPPDPGCADRPVEGAVVEVSSPDGSLVAWVVSDSTGHFTVELAPGRYRFTPQPAVGLLGTAAPVDAEVASGSDVDLTFFYDTGIR
jgi:hypothetical protein